MKSLRNTYKNVAFITGLPHFFAYKLFKKLIEDDFFIKIYVLVKKDESKKIYKFINKNLTAAQGARINVLEGHVASLDLGLSGKEYIKVTKEVSHIYHMASRYFYGMDETIAYKVNVIGTKNTIELGMHSKNLKRFNFYSTAFVSGNKEGMIMEDYLEKPKKFNNHYEKTKYEAEKLVRSFMDKMPVTIYRPSIIVGDSVSGKIHRFKGPYYLIKLFMFSNVFLPMPKKGETPINIVPIDFVVNSLYYISLNDKGINKTFHLVDPNPITVKEIADILYEKTNKSKKYHSIGLASSLILNTVFKVPILNKLLINQKTAFEFLYQNKTYSSSNTLELLSGTDISCPAFDSYVGNLINYLKEVRKKRTNSEGIVLFKDYDI